MPSRFLRALIVCAAVLGLLVQKTDPTGAASSGVVISQVYGGGGATTGSPAFKNDYIELFNRGSVAVSLAGMSVQYASSTGSFTQVTVLPSTTLQPGQYFLIQEATASGALGAVLPLTPDVTGGISMSATTGKVALVNGTAGLGTTGCPIPGSVVDLVGYGSGVNCSEGAPAPALVNTTSAQRAAQGCTDTDNNGADFSAGVPAPRNSATALHVCGATATNPSGTLSADAATYSPTDTITVMVNVTPGANPASTGLGVTANLSSLGLGTVTLHDDGLNADATAGDNKFTFAGVIAASTTGGVKTLTATVTDAQSRTAATNAIDVTVQSATAPTGSGSANPSSVPAGTSTLLTVLVTPGTNPVSSGVAVTADLSSIIPGDTAQVFDAAGSNVFTFNATVDAATAPGAKSLPVTIADGQGRSSGFIVPLTVTAPLANSTVVISQIYGGGGNNSTSPYQNDYVQLYNRGAAPIDLTGWTLQYASATGSSWTNKQPLGGPIAPGQFYLVSLASGGANGAALPSPNISGEINMSQTAGKLALVDNGDTLTGACPVASPHVKDFVGYGSTASCHEGSGNAPAPSASTAIFRQGGGAIDTNDNASDFFSAAPAPLTTAPIVEIGPAVLSTDPLPGASTAPRDATIDVTFTEPVDVWGMWYDIACTATGSHNDATTAVSNNAKDHYITPNANFLAGETCTVTIRQNQVSDVDTDDSAPNTDHLPADYSWSFTVATGAAPPYTPDVHLTMGNPSGAVADVGQPNNYLMTKPEYAVSYNRDMGRPNWVSWHLTPEWYGTLARVDTFRADPQVPPDWYRVQSFDFQFSGFDRGHMTPNADRDLETSIPINQATYLMSNMVAQAPDNNQGPWANLENYLRSVLGNDRSSPTTEMYVVSGPAGAGGSGSNGGTTTTLANGHVTVPAYTWKVALVLPYGTDDVSRVTCSTRTIAVIMPNVQGIRTADANDWMAYLTTVDAVEALTGFDLFSNVAPTIQNCIQAGVNGKNPQSQTIAFAPVAAHRYGDADFAAGATASSGLPVTLSVVSGPATIVGGLVHLTGVGTVTLRATQAGNVDPDPDNIGNTFARAVPVDQTFTVGKAIPVFTSLSSPTIEAGSQATVEGMLTAGSVAAVGTVTITSGSATATASLDASGHFSATLATASFAAASSPYAVAFSYSGDTNFTDASAVSTLRVVDTTPPAIGAVTASPGVVTVPDHKLFAVSVDYSASDFSGAPVCTLSVGSNEPVNGTGDGNTATDWLVIDAHHVWLRAERAGTGSGRIYTISATCTDAWGNAVSKTASVSVPK